MPFLPDFTIGPTYGLISDTFVPINPIFPPEADQQIFLTTSQDTWGGKERDNMNGLAFFPDPSFVPLLVGMYNGEITVDDAAIARAEANNGFDNKTGAIVIGRNKTVDFVIKNQIGDIGISVPHPVPPELLRWLTEVSHSRWRLLGFGWRIRCVHGGSLASSSGNNDSSKARYNNLGCNAWKWKLS